MACHARMQAESGIYHVMLRGINRDALFLEVEDYERFLHALALTKGASGCSVLAYCLMTNHVHLILRPTNEPIATVMKRLGVRYAGWFNRKYGRIGHVFHDRYKSLPVENDQYMAALLLYVWNNPVAAGLATCPEDYQWSSRRLLGTDDSLIDSKVLDRFLMHGFLSSAATDPPPIAVDAATRGKRYTQDEVSRFLSQACGAEGPDTFGELPESIQLHAINVLRTRSVPYAQIAATIGTSVSSVRRMHVAGAGSWSREKTG